MKSLLSEYQRKKIHIRRRLALFSRVYALKNDRDIFKELCFCLLTPQTRAVLCDRAIRDLSASRLLFEGDEGSIRDRLRGTVRFHNKKSAYVVAARDLFKTGKRFTVKKRFDTDDIHATREWLVKHVKGLGYKEASHFLRNIGLGHDIAILDIHILRNLMRYGVIKRLPATLSRNIYLAIEESMRCFARKIRIPLAELDLVFWSRQTGFIFK